MDQPQTGPLFANFLGMAKQLSILLAVLGIFTQTLVPFAKAQSMAPQQPAFNAAQIQAIHDISNYNKHVMLDWENQSSQWILQDLPAHQVNGTIRPWILRGFRRTGLELAAETMARWSVFDRGNTFCSSPALIAAAQEFKGFSLKFQEQCHELRGLDLKSAIPEIAQTITIAGIILNELEDRLFKLEGNKLVLSQQAREQTPITDLKMSKELNEKIRDIELQIAATNLEVDKLLSSEPLLMGLASIVQLNGKEMTLADYVRVQQRRIAKSTPNQDQMSPLVQAVQNVLPAVSRKILPSVEKFAQRALQGGYEEFLAFPTLKAQAFEYLKKASPGSGELMLADDEKAMHEAHFDQAGPGTTSPREYLITTAAFAATEIIPLARPWALIAVGATLAYVAGTTAWKLHELNDYRKATAIGAFVGANSFETARNAHQRSSMPLITVAASEITIGVIIKMKLRNSLAALRAAKLSGTGFVDFLKEAKQASASQVVKAMGVAALKAFSPAKTYNAGVNIVASLSMLTFIGMKARGDFNFADLMLHDQGFRTNFWVTAAVDALLGYYGGSPNGWDLAFVMATASGLGSIVGQKYAGQPVSWDRVAFDAAWVGSISTFKYRALYSPSRSFLNEKVTYLTGGAGNPRLTHGAVAATDILLAFANNAVGNGLYDWYVRTNLIQGDAVEVELIPSMSRQALGDRKIVLQINPDELKQEDARLPLPLSVIRPN